MQELPPNSKSHLDSGKEPVAAEMASRVKQPLSINRLVDSSGVHLFQTPQGFFQTNKSAPSDSQAAERAAVESDARRQGGRVRKGIREGIAAVGLRQGEPVDGLCAKD